MGAKNLRLLSTTSSIPLLLACYKLVAHPVGSSAKLVLLARLSKDLQRASAPRQSAASTFVPLEGVFMNLEYIHMDVFSRTAYSGNSVPVFLNASGLTSSQMLTLTQELRHFEAIFLEPTMASNTVRTRVFDLFEELPFAGHPIIGAAAALHHTSGERQPQTLFSGSRSAMVLCKSCHIRASALACA
jgi:hypothetical protein